MRRSLTERILEKIDIRGFYSRYAELSDASRKGELKGLCPLHQEKTPSFFVNLETGSFKCFGCGAGGGPVQFYAAYHGLRDTDAIERLADEFGLSSAIAGRDSKGKRRPGIDGGGQKPGTTLPPPNHGANKVASPQNSAVNVEIYTALLELGQPLSEEVLAYFASRKILPDTLARFRVSFVRSPEKAASRLRERFELQSLIRAGVLTQTDPATLWFQFRRHPLFFPIYREGIPVFVQGRAFPNEDSAYPKYCNLAAIRVPSLFNLDSLKDLPPESPVFICEGAPDTMTLVQQGMAAVGIIGSSGFKADWVSDLAGFKVYLALDNDNAGRKGIEKITRMFHQRKGPVFLISLPEGIKDINEFFLSNGKADFQTLISQAQERAVDLCTTVRMLLDRAADRSGTFSYRELAQRIYSWFEANGGVFAVDKENRCLLMFDRMLYQIDSNPPFNSLMFAKTDLIAVQHQGKVVWELLRNLCFQHGRRESNLSWIHTDQEEGIIYINLHNSPNQILRLRARDVDTFPNGNNPDHILLKTSDKMEAIDFDPKADARESVELLQRLVMEPLTCEPENKFFVCCWLLTAFFLDYTTDKALLKLSGTTGSGKTTAARILSCLLYGADRVESATVPYYYADASRNPYLICDNLETENMNRDIIQFLLHVATGISKGKRKAGTDSETVRESANSLVAITAIEPLTKPELINRTYDVEFQPMFKHPGFMQKEHLAELIRQRSRILSGLFLLFSREVLPGLQSHRQEVLAAIQQHHPQHSKQRIDAFLTLMVVILKALLKVLEPEKNRTWEIVHRWIQYQSRLAQETERDTNVAVYLLEGLAKEMVAKDGEFQKEYYLDFRTTTNERGDAKGISFIASARDLLMALQILSKNKGFKLTFSNTKQLSARLANETSILENAGWKRERDRTVHGVRYYRFSKCLL